MIRVENLTVKTATGKELISAVSFEIPKGQTLALYGPNGSGKSTLLRAMAGLSSHHEMMGEVTAQGVRVGEALTPAERVKRVVYFGSDFRAPFALEVKELFELGAEVMGRTQGEILEVVERLNLSLFLTRDFRTLSDGEKQLVMFARALIQKPEILIFDETFSKLDLDKLILVAKTVRHYSALGTTFVVASHDLNFLTETADDFLFLKKGQSVASGHVSRVLNLTTLATLYPDLALHVVVSPETGRHKVLY